MTRLAAVVLVLVPACDHVFDVAHVSHEVTGHYHQLYATNDASFKPAVVDRLYPAGTISFAVTLDDGTAPNVDYHDDDGSFSFPVNTPGQAYDLVVTDDFNTTNYQHTASELKLASLVAGRPDARALGAATLTFPYDPTGIATSSAWIYTTGLWSQTDTAQSGPTVRWDWRLAEPSPRAAVGLLDASANDEVWVAGYKSYSPASGPTYTAISAISENSITETLNHTSSLMPPVAITGNNRCAAFSAANADEYTRISTAQPRDYVANASNWYLYSAPAPDVIGSSGINWLADSIQNPAINFDTQASFYDPFGNPLIAEAVAYGDCVPLDTDGQVVPLDLSRSIDLTWSLVAVGPVDTTDVFIFEVVLVNGAPSRVNRQQITVVTSSATLDSTSLEPGHTYVVALVSRLMTPFANTGDFETVQFPIQNNTSFSSWFQVTAR